LQIFDVGLGKRNDSDRQGKNDLENKRKHVEHIMKKQKRRFLIRATAP